MKKNLMHQPTIKPITFRRVLCSSLVLGLFPLYASAVQVSIPGTSDPWLAGMPAGSQASLTDVAPDQSPAQVQGLDFSEGGIVTFSGASGAVGNGPSIAPVPPDGTGMQGHYAGAENGLSNVMAPTNAIVGVFLNDSVPSSSSAPSSPGGQNSEGIFTPFLKEVFFIGDGFTGAQQQQYLVPTGATRLFLGTMDGFEWKNNIGSFSIDVTLTPLKDNGKELGEPKCSMQAGNPINVASGLKFQREIDYHAPSGLIFERYYNGLASKAAWRHNWQRQVQASANNSSAKVIRADGKTYTFKLQNGVWQSDADINDRLTRKLDANNNFIGWTYQTENHYTENYSNNGQLVSVSDPNGKTTTLTYSDGTATGVNGGVILGTNTALPNGLLIRVTDAYQRNLMINYDAQLRLASIVDPANQSYNYAYDSNGNLQKVSYPDTSSRIYHYEDPNLKKLLTGIVDENNNRYVTWQYDSNGRAISSEHGTAIDKVTLKFNGDGSSTITDARGNIRSQSYQEILGVKRNKGMDQPGGSGCAAATNKVNYDTNGNTVSQTDFNGNTTCYTYDATRNLETIRIEGLVPGKSCPTDLSTATLSGVERKITTQWHSTYRVPTLIASPSRKLTFAYDSKGNLLSLTAQSTTDATGAAGANATVTGTARKISYTYTATGQLSTLDGARTDVTDLTKYTYDAQGNLATVTDALGRITTLSNYDAHGRPRTMIDQNKLITTLQYDLRGRLTNVKRGNLETVYQYDPAGNLIKVVLPSGASYSYGYDEAHRLNRISDKDGNYIKYTLDNAGNRTKEELFQFNGTLLQVHDRQFDALNRLWKDIGAVNQTTTYEYDANGNLTKVILPGVIDPVTQTVRNYTQSYGYDALNRLVNSSDPNSKVTRYAYNGQNQLTRVTDPRALVTQYQRDGLDNLLSIISPDTKNSSATYNAAGQLITQTNAKAQKTQYSYDALNRVTRRSHIGVTGQDTVYQYDVGSNALGHLVKITEFAGTANQTSTSYSYDQYGRILTSVRQSYGASYTTRYNYDAQGRLSSIQYPSGRIISYFFDNQARIKEINASFNGATTVLISNIRYFPFGGVQSFNYGDGTGTSVQSYSRQIDRDGRTSNYSYWKNGTEQKNTLGYDALSRITSITPGNTSTASYSYDPLSRLTGYTQGIYNRSFVYDVDGNRTSQLVGTTPSTYLYANSSNQLASVQTGTALPKAVTFDANGSTTTDGLRTYSYDVRGRLTQVGTAQGVTSYDLNAQGQRTRKKTATRDTVYHYDANGLLIGESAAGSTVLNVEYIYLGKQLVAIVK